MPELPKIDATHLDVGKAVAGVVAAAQVGRPPRRSRPRAVGGLFVAGIAGWVIMKNGVVRSRLARGVGIIRQRIQMMRFPSTGRADTARHDPVAFTAAETAPIEPAPYSDPSIVPTDYPAGLGSDIDDGNVVRDVPGSAD